MDDRELSGRAVLVTGGSSGIGREIARKMVSLGASVTLTGRQPEPLEAVKAELTANGGRCLTVPGDVRDELHAKDAVEKTVEAFGSLDILINNAGVIGAGSIEETSTEEWDRLIDIDLKGPFLFCRAAIPQLKKATKASIINVSSVAGRRPYANLTPYCVAKAAVDMLTQCLALELAPDGIRVNAINPGVVVTNLHSATNTVPDYETFLEHSKTTHPLGFVGNPSDAAELVAFLVSEKARWITGALHSLDGGRNIASAR